MVLGGCAELDVAQRISLNTDTAAREVNDCKKGGGGLARSISGFLMVEVVKFPDRVVLAAEYVHAGAG